MGVAALAATLAIISLTLNRLVQRKLRLSLFLFAGYLLFNLVVWQRPDLFPGLEGDLQGLERLVFAAAAINLLVYVLINPLRKDRVPDAFPSILQDAMVIGLLVLIATFVFEDKLLTTSAVGAVVVGFALQDTLGNAFAGLGIQSEKPFRVGHWIRVGDFEGRVAEVTWRATKLRTKSGNFVIVPNNIIAKDAITNYSEPAVPTRLEVEVGASYLSTPADVKAAALEALRQVPRVLDAPAPDVLLHSFDGSAITYRVRFWIADYELDDETRDEVRTSIFYAFGRRGIEIPWPIEVGYSRDWPEPDAATKQQERERVLARVDLFSRLTDEQRRDIAAASAIRAVRCRRGHRPAERPGAVDVHRLLRFGRRAARARSARGRRDRDGRVFRRDVAADGRRPLGVGRRAGRHGRPRARCGAVPCAGGGGPEGRRGDRRGRDDAPRAVGSDTRRDPDRRRGRCPGDVSGADEEVPEAGLAPRLQLPAPQQSCWLTSVCGR